MSGIVREWTMFGPALAALDADPFVWVYLGAGVFLGYIIGVIP